MTDRFKEYLLKNKDRLSPDEPGADVWEKISSRTVRKPALIVYGFAKWMAAASLVLLVGIGTYMLILKGNNNSQNENPVTAKPMEDTLRKLPLVKKDPDQLSDPDIGIKRQTISRNQKLKSSRNKKPEKLSLPQGAPPQFVYMSGEELAIKYQTSFTKLIEREKTMISTTPVYGVTSDYFDVLIKDYYQLEADEEKIKDKIKTTGGSLEALDEMIINFQRRIDLLKRLRTEIERKNNLNANKKGLQINYVRILNSKI